MRPSENRNTFFRRPHVFLISQSRRPQRTRAPLGRHTLPELPNCRAESSVGCVAQPRTRSRDTEAV
ncbi:hypothetical protein [Kingella potus]|uniref:hypothetical protein n=1 Tax=Kingella potus TaxID=265175 RepID=UPI001FD60A87|nr:hypothetical protein [Kingella potus]UOP01170.1 hypothetical protein LVJ84_02320 [Kingella potus]